MVIGGLANTVWGEPRATLDVDVTVWVDEREIDATARDLATGFRCLVTEPAAFVRETRVLPLESRERARIDVIFGPLPFEREAIARSVPVALGGTSFRCCTAEDLIRSKIVSKRDRDLADAKAIVLRRLSGLDLAYLEPRIQELADLLSRPEISSAWESWKAAATAR